MLRLVRICSFLFLFPLLPSTCSVRTELWLTCTDTELKARIEAFKAEKKGRKIAEIGLMDTSPG